MEKINVAELLRDCPKGMELDCTMWDNVTFEGIEDVGYINILVKIPEGIVKLSNEGCFTHNCNSAKCVIFPKGKTTWEGFVPPHNFKDGDILTTRINSIFIFSHLELERISNRNICKAYVGIRDTMPTSLFLAEESSFGPYESMCKLATEKEKEKLFQAIKDNGYKWNPETKTLEKLPKFKVGARIRNKKTHDTHTIHSIDEYSYCCGLKSIWIYNQDEYELVSDKFDITTLKAFESRVLVRGNEEASWIPTFWGYESMTGYVTTFGEWRYCIPYEGNEHLMGKTDDCDKYFKTWE